MIYHVFANKSNIGDWLSALGIQKLLAPYPVDELLCDQPFVADTLQRLRETTAQDLIVIGGGGLFMDYFEPFWRGLVDVPPKAPICIWGVGYCDLKRERSRPAVDLIRNVVAKSSCCFVRDALTWQLLGLPLPEPTGCPSLAAIEPPCELGSAVLHVDNYTTAGADVFDAMDAIGREYAMSSGRRYLRTNNRIADGNRRQLEETLDQYRQAEIVLSSALHGCIIAVAMRRKLVAVSGDWKIESFMQSVGLDEWVCSQEELTSTRLLSTLEAVRQHPSPAERIQEILDRNKAVAKQVLEVRRP